MFWVWMKLRPRDVRRRIGDAAAPRKRRHHVGRRAVPPRHVHRVEDFIRPVRWIDVEGVGKDVRKASHAVVVAVGFRSGRKPALRAAEGRRTPCDRAARLGVGIPAVVGLDEHRRIDGPVDVVHLPVDADVVDRHVGEAGDALREREGRLLIHRVPGRDAQAVECLVVDLEDGRVAVQIGLGRRVLIVVRHARCRRQVRFRIPLQDVQARLIEPVRRDPAQHAAVLEAGRGVRGRAGAGDERVLDVRIQVAVVVQSLGEVALPLQHRGHAIADDRAGPRARVELQVEEEEQLVVAAGLADRAAERPAVVLLLHHRLRVTIEDVGLAVGVPLGVPRHVIQPAVHTGWSRSW